MGQRAEQIEKEIEQERGALDRNLKELDNRVRDLTDWRRQFQKNPGPMLWAAFGAGFALALVAGRSQPARQIVVSPHQANQSSETWHMVKSALVGVLANRLSAAVDGFIPGFHNGYRYAEAKARASIAAL